MLFHAVVLGCLAGLTALCSAEEPPVSTRRPVPDAFQYVIGTQTFSPSYQFTDKPRLLETAEAILEMGSNTIKFGIGSNYHGERGNVPAKTDGIDSLTALVRDEPTHRAVLDMPFAHYLIWVYPFAPGWWKNGYSAEDSARQSQEIYDVACHLLKTYSGSGKAFYLGHWEGDWHLRDGYDTKTDDSVTPAAVQGMIDWLNARQKAVDDAKRDTPHHGVEVWNYCEVNLVKIGLEGRKCVTNDVLPHTSVDFVSYSAYDTQNDPETLGAALNHIESKLPPKEGIAGKRVFIGEYGFPAEINSPAQQDKKSRQVMRVALEWGCPFALYWEMFSNEVRDGKQRGFWLIDDRGEKQPVYHAHARFYAWAREFIAEFRAAHGREPSRSEFGQAGAAFLDSLPQSDAPRD